MFCSQAPRGVRLREPKTRLKVRDELIAHFTAFANGDDTKGHVLVHGDAGRGKRWVLRSALGKCLGSGVRVVQVSLF